MFLLLCDQKLAESEFSTTLHMHQLKEDNEKTKNAECYRVRERHLTMSFLGVSDSIYLHHCADKNR